MTAINDLVEAAGVLNAWVSLQALDDMVQAIGDMLAQEVFRVEFRMPAEPVDVREEPEPVSVSQVDVYALAREMEGALRGLVVPGVAPSSSATAPRKDEVPVAPAILNVNTITKELRERLEVLEKETVSLPAVCSDLYTGRTVVPTIDRPFSGDRALSGGLMSAGYPHEPDRTPAGDRAIPPIREATPSVEKRVAEKLVQKELLETSVKKSAAESTEQSVKRSASVVRELEDVYERLASSTVDVDKEVRRTAISELDTARAGAAAPPLEKGVLVPETPPQIPTIPTRNLEVPAFKLIPRISAPSEQAADNVKRLSGAMERSTGPAMPKVEPDITRAPTESPAPVQAKIPAVPVVSTHIVTPPAPVVVALPALVAVHNSLDVMNRYLDSATGMASTVDRMVAGGTIVQDTQALSSRALAEIQPSAEKQSSIQVDAQALQPRIIMQPAPVVVAPPALVAVNRSFSVINRYLASAAAMSTGRIPDGSAGSQEPLVQLMLDRAPPVNAPVNMLLRAGESITVPVPQPMLIEGGGSSPAMNLAVNVAAARAIEHSDHQAMLNLARDAGYAPAGKESVNANPPGTISHVTDNNTTNKTFNYHNTFNITVTVKGAGTEEGDLRDLGKKIGRILSDEIKRYGGI